MSTQELEVIILKKQPLTDPDELITVLSGKGKFRAVAKASKRTTSKLAYALQPISLVSLRLSGKNELQQITGATLIDFFPEIRDNPELVKIWYEICEIILKGLPDWQESVLLMENLKQALETINQSESELVSKGVLAKFKIDFLEFIGFKINPDNQEHNWFDLSSGVFSDNPSPIVLSVAKGLSPMAFELQEHSYDTLSTLTLQPEVLAELNKVLTEFATYHLERKLQAGNMIY